MIIENLNPYMINGVKYGKRSLTELFKRLMLEIGKGYSKSNLLIYVIFT
jgi:hypothetical protein